MFEPLVIVPPIKDPVSLTEAKAQCRIDGSTEDALLGIFIAAARDYVEWRTSRTIHDTTLEYVLDGWPGTDRIALPRATPLIEIVSVKYKDSAENETTWSPTEYLANTDAVPGELALAYGKSWPSFTPSPVSPIRIRYRAGKATGSPEVEAADAIKYAVLLLVGGMYENRESENIADRGVLSKLAADYGVEAFLARLIADYAF
jgi:uncharacterized phiE125 gp8 family phage protein